MSSLIVSYDSNIIKKDLIQKGQVIYESKRRGQVAGEMLLQRLVGKTSIRTGFKKVYGM